MLNLDLNLCETGERFQSLCFRIARKQFPDCMPVGVGSWDKGLDIIEFSKLPRKKSIIWQCKFTKKLTLSALKGKIKSSLESLDVDFKFEWILCISSEATGTFLLWLEKEVRRHPLIIKFSVWDKTEILKRLEGNPELLEIYFYRSYAELGKYFDTEDLSLVDLQVGDDGNWMASDPNVLQFRRKVDNESDMIVDVIVKNKGSSEALISEVFVEIVETHLDLKGIPQEALLIPKITYEISVEGGKPGIHRKRLEPPLIVKPKSHERFKVKIKDIGYAWFGELKISIGYGKKKRLRLPTFFVYT